MRSLCAVLPKKRGAGLAAQVKSKQRVADHGEVFTNPREVNAMLDMVKQETERIESRFLEPACGNGNFLAEVLRRKLAVVASSYRKSPHEYMRYAFVAVTSIYGVDILQDNVQECRERLFGIVAETTLGDIKDKTDLQFLEAVRFVLQKNLLCGDALTLKDAEGDPIRFAEWSIVTGDKVKRRDYLLSELLEGSDLQQSLFGGRNEAVEWEFDEETQTYLPSAIEEFPPVNWWEVQRYE